MNYLDLPSTNTVLKEIYGDYNFGIQDKDMRKESDNYPTPELLANAISEYVLRNYFNKNDLANLYITEPACGDGAFLKALRFHAGPSALIFGNDIRTDIKQLKGATNITYYHNDWLTTPNNWFDKRHEQQLIITNPPYTIADKFAAHTLEIVPVNSVCAFLLRLSFLSGQTRCKELYAKYGMPFELVPITPRPSFTDNGKTDASEYALFIWIAGVQTSGKLSPHLVWK